MKSVLSVGGRRASFGKLRLLYQRTDFASQLSLDERRRLLDLGTATAVFFTSFQTKLQQQVLTASEGEMKQIASGERRGNMCGSELREATTALVQFLR